MRNEGAIMVAVPIRRKFITTTAMYFSVKLLIAQLLVLKVKLQTYCLKRSFLYMAGLEQK